MLKKSFNKLGTTCRVTFSIPAEVHAQRVNLCGEFNNWNKSSHPMLRRRDRRFSLTLTLKTGHNYRFRYLIDGEHWENDWEADAYVLNDFGSEDSVVAL